MFIPKICSIKIVDLAHVICPSCNIDLVAIRPGEKLHEILISSNDSRNTIEFDSHYVIIPNGNQELTDYYIKKGGKKCDNAFCYGSNNNCDWISKSLIIQEIASLDLPEAKEWVDNNLNLDRINLL